MIKRVTFEADVLGNGSDVESFKATISFECPADKVHHYLGQLVNGTHKSFKLTDVADPTTPN